MLKLISKGFTVIEIAVVITVIAILASVALVGYQQVVSDGDDAKFLAEYNDIRNAIQLYESRHNAYPGCPGEVDSCSLVQLTPILGVKGIRTNDPDGVSYQYVVDNNPSDGARGWALRMFDRSASEWCVMRHGIAHPWPGQPLCWDNQ